MSVRESTELMNFFFEMLLSESCGLFGDWPCMSIQVHPPFQLPLDFSF